MTETKAPPSFRSAGAVQKNIIIIGAGHNGLVAAAYLAKAGFKPLVLERRNVIGGACATEEFHPGFHASLANSAGPLVPQIINDLQLTQHGLQSFVPDVRVCALRPDGPAVCIYEDAQRTAKELAVVSSKDAAAYPEFAAAFARIGRALRPLLTLTPPDLDAPSKSELWQLGKIGWGVRGLGKRDEYRLLRYGPMAVADLAAEWFENELLRALVAAGGIFGAFAGPWSAGTSAPLLLQAAHDGSAIRPANSFKGNVSALTKALAEAATSAGAQLRTGAEVAQVTTTDRRVSGVVLSTGEELPAWTVISDHDPGSTLLQLIDPGELDPTFRTMISNYRAKGAVAKLNLAVSALPNFGCDAAALTGRVHIGPEIDYLERAFDAAKYGDFSPRPFIEMTIPSLHDPAQAPQGAHVISIHAQFAPYKLKQGDWDSRREELAATVIETLAEYAPDLKQLIVGQQIITPVDLEKTYGMAGGHIHHGEMSLDQLFAFRPLIGWARYRTPIAGLYLCGAGTHPGGGITGAPGFNASREIIKDLKLRKQ